MMRTCRQLLAAGLLLAVSLVGPVRAAPAAPASPAELQIGVEQISTPAAISPRAYLPLIHKGGTYDVAVARVEVIQGITQGDSYTYHVAGRPALLRVFVSIAGGSSLSGVTAR